MTVSFSSVFRFFPFFLFSHSRLTARCHRPTQDTGCRIPWGQGALSSRNTLMASQERPMARVYGNKCHGEDGSRTGSGDDVLVSRYPVDLNVSPSTSWVTRRGSRDGRKARRALRKRINPEQQRCGERMIGPRPLFDNSKRIPKLPRGGDGLAEISLRPSLVQRSRNSAARAPEAGRSRRPFKEPYGFHESELTAFSERDSRLRSLSAPPITGGGRGGAANNIQQQDAAIDPSFETADTDDMCAKNSTASSNSEERGLITPCRPEGVTRTIRRPSYDNFQRMLRDGCESTLPRRSTHDERGQPQRLQDIRDRAGEFQHELEETTPTTEYEKQPSIDITDFATQNSGEDGHDLRAQSPHDGRGASVILSSTILLSPRGRSKTPTLPTDTSANRRTFQATQDGGADEWTNNNPPPRPRTTDDTHADRRLWLRPPSCPPLGHFADEPWMADDADIQRHVASEVSRGTV